MKDSLRLFLGIVIILILLCVPPGAFAATDADSFVTRQGTKFYLNGKEFMFVGFNLFDAANTYFPEQGKHGYSCPRDAGWWSDIYTEQQLDAAMKQMKAETGATVLRFWAFQRYTNGGTDWSGIDKVLRVARNNGFKVLPVLEDGPGYCTYPEPQGNAKWKYQNDTWYTDGYKLKMGSYALTYPEYVRAIVTRYKDNPTIMGWMMVNEADTSRKVNGKSSLVGFATDIGTLIKNIDNKHLLTVGTQSNGASGATGADFVDVYGLPMIDFTEIHDWPYWGGDTDPLPGSPDGKTLPDPLSPDCTKTYQAKLACSIANSVQVLNKPIVMGEAGISARDSAGRMRRADLMDKKMKAFFDAGGAGYLVWQWNKVIDGEAYDVQGTTNDPLLPKMKQYSGMQLDSGSVTPGGPTPTRTPTRTPTVTPPMSNKDFVRGVNLFGGWQGIYDSRGEAANVFATDQQLDYFKAKGFTHFRVGFSWQHLQPVLGGDFNPTYLAKMDSLMDRAAALGLKIAFVPLPATHQGKEVVYKEGSTGPVVSQSDFNNLWVRMAQRYKDHPALWGYNLLNEPNQGHGPNGTVKDMWNTQIGPSALNAIRTVDMKNLVIMPTSTGGYGHNFTIRAMGLPMNDPANNIMYEAHFYFDLDPNNPNTGQNGWYDKSFDTYYRNQEEGFNSGVTNARGFAEWCTTNNVRCLAGEYGVPGGWDWGHQTCLYNGKSYDPRWMIVLDRFMTLLDEHKISGTYWSGGPYGDVSSLGPFCPKNQAQTPPLSYTELIDGPQMAVLTKHLGSNVTSPTGNPTATPSLSEKADINGNGCVDLIDYSLLVSEFLKQTAPANPRVNINGNASFPWVDLTDYSLLRAHFGTGPNCNK